MFSLQCVSGLMDIEVVILDDRNFSESRFAEAVAQFDPVVIENGTVRSLLLSPPVIQKVAFINPVMCVGTKCYNEDDLPAATPPPPSPTPPPPPPPQAETSGVDTVVIASVAGGGVLVILCGICYFVMKRRDHSSINTQFRRVVIRETIDLRLQVKTGSKHTRCAI